MKTICILADNQDITREGVISLLHQQYGTITVIEVACRSELREKLSLYPQSAVILDYTLFDYASVNHFLNACAGAEECSWLLFSDELNEVFLRQVLFANRSISVAMKHDRKKEIIEAVESVLSGNVYLCETAKSALECNVITQAEPKNLTATEKHILREIALGKMTKEIAIERSASFHTINTHRKNIFRKLQVTNVHDAKKYALQAGLVDMMEYYL